MNKIFFIEIIFSLKIRRFSLLFLPAYFAVFQMIAFQSLFSQEAGEESRVNYEIGMSYLLKGDKVHAREFFEKAKSMEGESADLSSLELVRLLGQDADAVAMKQIIKSVKNEDFAPKIWMAGIESLIEYQKYDPALELAIEMTTLYPDNPLTDDILYMSGEIFYRQKAYPSAIEKLYIILKNYEKSDHADDACYLLSKIYGETGEYYSSSLEYYMLKYFINHLDVPSFKNSIWLEIVRKKLEERYPTSLNS